MAAIRRAYSRVSSFVTSQHCFPAASLEENAGVNINTSPDYATALPNASLPLKLSSETADQRHEIESGTLQPRHKTATVKRRHHGPKAVRRPGPSAIGKETDVARHARLLNALRQRTTDLTESLEQQTTTSEVLKVIRASPGQLKPVFETLLEVDVKLFAHNLARLIEEGGKVLSAYLKPREEGKVDDGISDQVTEAIKSVGRVAGYWLTDPRRAVEMQASLGCAYLDLWANAVKRMTGQPVEPVATPDSKDRRFADPEWSSNQFFDFLKQAYLLTTHWADYLVEHAEGLDPYARQKAEFYVQQIANAISPSNFVLTNPELLRATLSSNAENLVRGMHMCSARTLKPGKVTLRFGKPT